MIVKPYARNIDPSILRRGFLKEFQARPLCRCVINPIDCSENVPFRVKPVGGCRLCCIFLQYREQKTAAAWVVGATAKSKPVDLCACWFAAVQAAALMESYGITYGTIELPCPEVVRTIRSGKADPTSVDTWFAVNVRLPWFRKAVKRYRWRCLLT